MLRFRRKKIDQGLYLDLKVTVTLKQYIVGFVHAKRAAKLYEAELPPLRALSINAPKNIIASLY